MASKAAVGMTWEKLPQVMVDVFPDLRDPYEELLALWSERSSSDDTNITPGNHVVYGDIFCHYLILLLRGHGEEKHYLRSRFHPSGLTQKERIERTREGFDFLEGMCLNEDIRVQEVAVVTVLEYMSGRSSILALAAPYLGPALRKGLKELQDFWGQ